MTDTCAQCNRIYLTSDPHATVCRTRHQDHRGFAYTCSLSFCSGDCYERHLLEKESV